ncbi:MAG: FHA domain-containing protein [Myxococcota bacterium]
MTRSVVIGRSSNCDVRIDHPTVSARHARLRWDGKRLLLEDLGSANGTFVRGHPTTKTHVRIGDDVRLGEAELPWSDRQLRPLLREGSTGTLVAQRLPRRRFVCGACGKRGVMPRDFKGGLLRCGHCGQRLEAGPKGTRVKRPWRAATFAMVVAVLAAVVWIKFDVLVAAASRLGELPGATRAASEEERSIRVHSRRAVTDAIDTRAPVTRNTAARIASVEDGPFRVEQVARIWSHVRGEWRYVNDPRGTEYFALASETIDNGFVGDCDDFAIVLAAMIEAIGGEARIVMMGGVEGGHAYAEACVHGEASEVRDRLVSHYRTHRDPNLGQQSVGELHFRPGQSCPVWLNLDWNAGVPGGAYEVERWAVAVYPDGRTETLAPANPL